MLLVLICLLISMIIGSIIACIADGDIEALPIGLVGGVLIGIIPSLLIGSAISAAIWGLAPLECKYSQNLIALKDNSAVSGSFFLGCGNIDSEMSYAYAVETEKGIATVTIKQSEHQIYIKYTDDQPHVEYWSTDDPWRFPEESPYYIFYLPQGSIIENYEIDLE